MCKKNYIKGFTKKSNNKMFNKTAVKNKQTSFEYHFSSDVSPKPYFSVEIPLEKIKEIYEKLKEKYGETENITVFNKNFYF